MVDLFADDVMTLKDAAKALPNRPHVSTIWRWATHGVGPERKKLETISIGGRRYTSRQAMLRFAAMLTANERSSTHNSQADAADQQLDQLWS